MSQNIKLQIIDFNKEIERLSRERDATAEYLKFKVISEEWTEVMILASTLNEIDSKLNTYKALIQ